MIPKPGKKPLFHGFLWHQLCFFLIYVVHPITQPILMSLYDWGGIGEKVFIGLLNYVDLWCDPQFWISLKNNTLWLAFYMLAVPIGLGIALFLNQ